MKTFLKPRSRDFHKGMAGHVLVIGGDMGFSGAVILAGVAALRVGAGLVSVATRKEHASVLNIVHPELMCHGVQSEIELQPLIAKANVIVAGPGLQQSDWAKNIFNQICETEKPLVLDADGLNLLASQPRKKQNWILTPHPGEAARLLKTTAEKIQADRKHAVTEIFKTYGGVAVLKGAGSLTASLKEVTLCKAGNPGMATGGMGDVLSGVIGGLLAQGVPLADAAKWGVFIHAKAGDLAAKQGARGMIASDLFPFLRALVN